MYTCFPDFILFCLYFNIFDNEEKFKHNHIEYIKKEVLKDTYTYHKEKEIETKIKQDQYVTIPKFKKKDNVFELSKGINMNKMT